MMKRSVNPLVAVAIIVGALGIIGFVYWRAGMDRPIPEGPGQGRIGRTMNLGAKAEERKSRPAKDSADKGDAGKSERSAAAAGKADR